MATYEIEIEGAADMIHNRLSRNLITEMKAIPRGKKDEWEEQNWRRKLYTANIDGKEQIVIPDANIYAMLIESCRRYRTPPPTSIGRTWTQYFKSSVLPVDNVSVIQNAEVEEYGAMLNANPSSSKKSSKVYRIRPRIKKGWKIKLTVMDSEDYLNENTMTEIMETAGKFVGIGDMRPLFGRFVVKRVKKL